jgi:hypothetical protein
MSSDDDEEDLSSRAGKSPMIRPAKRGLAYSKDDAYEISSFGSSSSDKEQGEERSRPRLKLSLSWTPKKLKPDTSTIEPSNSDEYYIELASHQSLPPLHIRSIVHYSASKETYFEQTRVYPWKPIFKHILDFINTNKDNLAVVFFRDLISPRLSSKEFLNLRRLCKNFNTFLMRIYQSKTKSCQLFKLYYESPWEELSSPLCFQLRNYTYRTIYRQLLTKYAEVGTTAFTIIGKRKVPDNLTIPLQGTMETFCKFDHVMDAIRQVFASNTMTQRKELKRVLDTPVATMQAYRLISETMLNYPDIEYQTDFADRQWCFVTHLEAKLFILIQCPQLIDLPDPDKEIVSSSAVIKTIVKEIHDVLLCLDSAADDNDHVTKLVAYLVKGRVIKQLLVLTACFRGGSLSDWDKLPVECRNSILRVCHAKNRLETLSSTDEIDDWETIGEGSVIIKTCRELLQIKISNGEAHGKAVDIIKSLE